MLTSDFEGFGMVLIEAQARGVVPITFNCFSAINEVVENNISGLILDNDTIQDNYEKIKKIINKVREISIH